MVLVLLALIIGDLLDGLFHLDVLGGDLFSFSSIAAFVGSFGFGGALGLGLTSSPLAGVVIGLVIGSLAAWGAVALTKALKSGEDAAGFRSESMIGHSGIVITPIPGEGYGEIRLSVGGHVRKLSAKSAQPVAAGQEVWVSSILSPTAVEVTPTTPELTTY